MHSDYPLVCRLVFGGFVGMVIVWQKLAKSMLDRQACERDLLMRGPDEHHYGEHNRARLVCGNLDFWQPNGPDSQCASALLVP
jgi:hypothetical protein